jgi:hypothetical protein
VPYPLGDKGEALLGVEPKFKALQALAAPCHSAVAGVGVEPTAGQVMSLLRHRFSMPAQQY